MSKDSWKPNFITSAYFLGWCSTLLWIPYMADIFGRKPLVSIAMALCAVLYAVLMFTESLDTTIVVSFMLGMLSSARESIAFIYLNELVPKSS